MGEYSFEALTNFLATVFQGSYTIDGNGTTTYESDAIDVLVDTLLLESYDQKDVAICLNGFTISITNA